MKNQGFEVSASFDEAIDMELKRIDILEKQEKIKMENPFFDNSMIFNYVRHGDYASRLEEWFKYFPKKQFLIFTNTELTKDPAKFTNKTSIDGMVNPLHYWVPSIAPSGMLLVKNPKYPTLDGSILIGSLKFQYLHQCIIENGKIVKENKLFEEIGRVRSIELDNYKNIYIGVENLGILKLIE